VSKLTRQLVSQLEASIGVKQPWQLAQSEGESWCSRAIIEPTSCRNSAINNSFISNRRRPTLHNYEEFLNKARNRSRASAKIDLVGRAIKDHGELQCSVAALWLTHVYTCISLEF